MYFNALVGEDICSILRPTSLNSWWSFYGKILLIAASLHRNKWNPLLPLQRINLSPSLIFKIEKNCQLSLLSLQGINVPVILVTISHCCTFLLYAVLLLAITGFSLSWVFAPASSSDLLLAIHSPSPLNYTLLLLPPFQQNESGNVRCNWIKSLLPLLSPCFMHLCPPLEEKRLDFKFGAWQN